MPTRIIIDFQQFRATFEVGKTRQVYRRGLGPDADSDEETPAGAQLGCSGRTWTFTGGAIIARNSTRSPWRTSCWAISKATRPPLQCPPSR